MKYFLNRRSNVTGPEARLKRETCQRSLPEKPTNFHGFWPRIRSVRAPSWQAFPAQSAALDKLAKAGPRRGGPSPQGPGKPAACTPSLVLAQLAIDGAGGDPEQLRGQGFVAP